jgi:glutamate-ammonia-ligase adenylyltransferase
MASQHVGAAIAPLSRVAPLLPSEPASASHSRFVQRIRRRYAAELALLPVGLPDRAAMIALVELLQSSKAQASPT